MKKSSIPQINLKGSSEDKIRGLTIKNVIIPSDLEDEVNQSNSRIGRNFSDDCNDNYESIKDSPLDGFSKHLVATFQEPRTKPFEHEAKLLKSTRFKLGLTQQQMGELLQGKCGQLVSNAERGLTGLKLSKWRILVKAGAVSPFEISGALTRDYERLISKRLE